MLKAVPSAPRSYGGVEKTSPPPAARAYDVLAGKWDSLYVDRRAVAEDAFTYGLVADMLSGGSVLDAACGTGALLDHVSIPLASYLGVDISTGMLDVARQRHPGYRFRQESMVELSGISEHFMDAVFSPYCGFSYLTAPDAAWSAAREFHRILKAGGLLMVMVYGAKSREAHAYEVAVDGVQVPRQVWQPAEFAKLFQDAGFQQVQVRGLSYFVDRLPSTLPQWLFNAWVRAEAALLGRKFPGAGYFTYVTARK